MQNPFGNGNNDDNNDNNNNQQNMIPIPPNFATVVNKETGQIRIAKVGFSFTALIFGWLVPIFRSDWYNFLCIFGIELIVGMGIALQVNEPLDITFPIASNSLNIIWMFIYNMMYFKHLFKIGYVPADERSKELLTEAKYWKENK
ncbi:MAG: hypothetical protein ABF679_06530 [Lentilactobacillus diolivorans]|jgi:hypothetical protein|uniref:hypothetical protein n=1 Tax=Lentilactobacillus diolivorans TaxID=179838 RepID=UPI000FEFDB62|nr:hypothetical protein [Lentilactobacillus diolivorans]MCH4165539.1 hypothetical protein [Lentilactobacillus diolivorans]MDH5105812.1 hypothetical protein [Lentilactobacillus diolivorans]RRG03635.1 MAG: hypothetical protein DUD34_05020 [Lactobacillus sp.]